MARIIPQVPGSTDQEHLEQTQNAIGMGMGMSMPEIPGVRQAGGWILKKLRPAAPALDPVAEQIARVNAAAPNAAAPASRGLPELPKAVEAILPWKVKVAYKLLGKLAGKGEGGAVAAPSNPYPAETPYIPPPRQGIAHAAPVAQEIDPAMQAGAEASRARVLSQIQPAAPPQAPVSAPIPAPPQVAQSIPVAAAEQPVANIFERAARGKKVQELVKAIDANAGAHLGVDPLDPRFAEALADMSAEWWHGMAQVSKINKPSADTISDAAAFFRDRAAQSVAATAK